MSSDAAATSVTSAMRSALSPANLSEAGAFAKERTEEFQRNLHDGSWSLRFLALLGALAMMTIAVLGFLHDVREYKRENFVQFSPRFEPFCSHGEKFYLHCLLSEIY